MKRFHSIIIAMLLFAGAALAQPNGNDAIGAWAATPPMGWNSWDCYGPSVVESEVKANADYMAAHLLRYGWEYVVVDIRWFVDNQTTGTYLQDGTQQYVIDEYGRYMPSPTRFPSARNGAGFKPLADYCHALGLKFGIHIMRGLPKVAAAMKCKVKGMEGVTCDQIASNDSACSWLRDNYKVECSERGQAYYNSIFSLYAEWGVDYVKVDDIARPYHRGEIEMIHKAIMNSGRPIVLSLSPGETPTWEISHLRENANLWRTVDDFWDNWPSLRYQFGVCAKWAPLIAQGHWPDADMLPLGHLCIRGERGADRNTNFTRDEQLTLMNLWTMFKSPLMFGGNLPDNDEFTKSLLTNEEVLLMHRTAVNNRQVSDNDGLIVWSADDPQSHNKWVALFNATGDEADSDMKKAEGGDNMAEIKLDLRSIGIAENAPCVIIDVWSGKSLGTFKNAEFSQKLRPHASGLYKIVPNR